MRTISMSGSMRRLLAVLAIAAAPMMADGAASQAAGPGVRPAVAVAAEAGGGSRVEVRLERDAAAPQVGSFQGELRFDPAALTLAGAELPAGLVGAWNQVEPGRVRFAGVSPNGLAGGAVLVLRFTSRAPVAPNQLQVRLEEVFAVDGRSRLAP